MSYETYLHRSFDYQLSPVPSSVIDWANTRRAYRAVMPSSSAGGSAAAAPLCEVATQSPWKVKLTALEKAAKLEAQRRSLQEQPQQSDGGVTMRPDGGVPNGAGREPPRQHSPSSFERATGGARSPQLGAAAGPLLSPGTSMCYFIDENAGASAGPVLASHAAAAASGTHPLGSNGVGPLRRGPGALVMYPTDGSVYAATSPEGEVLGLYSDGVSPPSPSASPLPPASRSAFAAAGSGNRNGGGSGTHSTNAAAPPAPPQQSCGPSPAVVVGVHAGLSTDGLPSSSPPNPVVHTVPDAPPSPLLEKLMDGAVQPAWQLLKDVVQGTGGGVDLTGSRHPLNPRVNITLSDYVWSSYGSLPLWRRGSFAASAGVYTAFGFTHTEHRQLRDVRRQAQPPPARRQSREGTEEAHHDHNLTSKGMATALLREWREDPCGNLEKPRVGEGAGAIQRRGANNNNNNNSSSSSNGRATARGDVRPASTVDVGTIDAARALRVMNVVQLEWFWARWRWQGVVNVRLLPLPRHTRVPLCEYVMRTPWTEWAVQSDELVFNWNAFLTLYQQHAPKILLEREEAFQSMFAAAIEAEEEESEKELQRRRTAVAAGTGAGAGARRSDVAKSAKEIAQDLVDRRREEKLGQQQRERAQEANRWREEEEAVGNTRSEGGALRHPHTAPPAHGKTAVAVAVGPTTTAAAAAAAMKTSTPGPQCETAVGTSQSSANPPRRKNEDSASDAAPIHVDARRVPHEAAAAATAATPSDAETAAPARAVLMPPQRTAHWWTLRHLKVGAGVSVKNDLASGINLYWGCSGQMGRGLSFSGHVDVLRRMCCAVSSSLGPLDLSVRLRMNLITFHSTALDAGVCYRPFSRHANTAIKASTSAAGRCVGVQVDDLTHEFFSDWIASHAEQRIARRLSEQQRAVEARIAGSKGAKDTKGTTSTAPQPAASSPPPTSPPVPDGTPPKAQDGEGGWISFGLVSSAWRYLCGSHTPTAHSEAQRQQALALQQQQEREAAAAAAEAAAAHSFRSRAAHLAKSAPRQLAALPGQWYAAAAAAVHVPAPWHDAAVSTAQAIKRASVRSWQEVKQLDWLEAMLASARMDVSVGVTHDPGRPGGGLRSFLIVSAH